MRTLTKIFVAVAFAFASFACTTDATNDLGIEMGGKDLTSITLSLEESRTQLGERVGDLYPLYWSEGDQISVNGVASGALSTDAAGAATATFTVAGTLEKPYYIAYPAAPAGQVLFAEKQTHSSNTTFGSGVSTMYAYSEDGAGAQLNHLTGVLKIGVVGNAKLVLAQVSTADRKPIAGAFDFNFEKGEASATATSKEVIEYSFGEGIQLSGEPTYLHIAVPAGEYDEVYVTLYDEDGGVMFATVKANSLKPLTVGKIREFANSINYAPNSSLFVVRDVASLKAFGEQAATLEKDVLFVADVDMTGEAWTPIEGYAGLVNGNGYAIKGMTAPLFGTTNASIKGLHFVDVNIEETNCTTVGALARLIELSDANLPVVEHCSVSGKVVLNNTTVPYAKDASRTEYNYVSVGGLIGFARGVQISDCVNKARVEIKQSVPTGNTQKLYPSIGGVLGFADTATQASTSTAVTTNYYDLTNYGDVSATVSSYTGETTVAKYSPLQPYIGGVVGTSASANANCDFKNLKNYGNVTLSGKIGNGAALGGAIGYVRTYTGSHVYNYGKVTAENAEIFYLYMGGVIAIGAKSTALCEVHNYGEVYTDESATCGYFVGGGVLGYQGSNFANADSANSYIRNSSNSGPINISHNDFADNLHDGTAFYYRVGGISGWTQNYIENCNNLKGGTITCTGNIHQCDDSIYSVCIGGLVGYKTISAVCDSHNDADVISKINMTTNEGYALGDVRLNIGGITGYNHLACSNVTNNGTVSVEGSLAGQLRLGGLFGHANGVSENLPVSDNCVNNGKVIIKSGTRIGYQMMIGGVASYLHKNSNCTNNGLVIIEDDVQWGHTHAYIGGVAAYTHGPTENMTNNGPITIGKNCSFSHAKPEYLYFGGVIGQLYSDADGIVNTEKGIITLDDSTYASYVLGGGCIGTAPATNAKATAQVNFFIKNVTNYGAINSYASHSAKLGFYIGGCFGYLYEETVNGTLTSPDVDNAHNYGPITIKGDDHYTVKIGGIASYIGGLSTSLHNHETGTINIDLTTRGTIQVGGVSQAIKDTASDITNDGDITINGTAVGTVYVGGCIKDPHNYKRTNCVNNGDITINAKSDTGCFVGGIAYDGGAKNYFTDCHNTGNITFGEEASQAKYLAIGGLIGKIETSSTSNYNVFTRCSNSGNIHLKGNVATSGYACAGGCYGFIYGASMIIVDGGFTNSGDIIYEGEMTTTYTGTDTHKTRNSLDMGGFAGWVVPTIQWTSKTYPTWTGNVVNTGSIKHLGKSSTNVHIGGIFGYMENTAPPISNGKFINTGDIVFTGSYKADAVPHGVGGLAGVALKGFENGQAYCTINAPQHPAAGMAIGSSRTSENIAKNCEVGGTIMVEYDEGEDVAIETNISASNFHKYLYGGTTNWSGVENYDGCSYLASKPTIQ